MTIQVLDVRMHTISSSHPSGKAEYPESQSGVHIQVILSEPLHESLVLSLL